MCAIPTTEDPKAKRSHRPKTALGRAHGKVPVAAVAAGPGLRPDPVRPQNEGRGVCLSVCLSVWTPVIRESIFARPTGHRHPRTERTKTLSKCVCVWTMRSVITSFRPKCPSGEKRERARDKKRKREKGTNMCGKKYRLRVV